MFAVTQAPLRDHLRVEACLLLRASRGQAALDPAPRLKINRKDLPKSVKPYLRPSGMVDWNTPPVLKAAREVLRKVGRKGPHAAENPALMLEGVREFVAARLKDAPSENYLQQETSDIRKDWPKASGLLKLGKADAFGRARLSLALLRALGVPARSCWVQGQPHLQAWMNFAKPLKSKGHKPALGFWRVEDPALDKEPVDAWSLDSSEVAPLRWLPQQEVQVSMPPRQHAYYALSESDAAEAEFNALTRTGRLSEEALRRSEPPQGAGGYLEVVARPFVLSTEGPLGGFDALEFLAPYVPDLRSWGKEMAPPNGRVQQIEQALWTDRPDRYRHGNEGLRDEWETQPQTLGVLHYLSATFTRPPYVVDADFQGDSLVGKVLKANSLAVPKDAQVQVDWLGLSPQASASPAVDSKGRFETALPAAVTPPSGAMIRAGAGPEKGWDTLLLERSPRP